MNLLKQVSFGHHYVEIALLLRQSLFLGSILNNVEVMYGMTKTDMLEFDNLDILLLRRILNSPSSTPKESYYLELGISPPSILIKSKRINYLHYLLKKRSSEMLSMFFNAQRRNPCKGDWINSVKQDLVDFGIAFDTENIINTSKQSFKTTSNPRLLI